MRHSRWLGVCVLGGSLLACGGDADESLPFAPTPPGPFPVAPEEEPVQGPVPEAFDYQLQARQNFRENDGGTFNIPPNHFSSNESASLNEAGSVAFRVTVTGGRHKSVWVGGNGEGELVFSSPLGVDAFLGAPALNDSGKVVFEMQSVPRPGVYYYEAGHAPEAGMVSALPRGADGRRIVYLGDDGTIGMRARFSGAYGYYRLRGREAELILADSQLEPDSPYSFLFTPDFNARGEVAALLRHGPGIGDERPDVIRRLFRASSVLIAGDRAAVANSQYRAFDSTGVAINARGQVAFAATLMDGTRGVFLSDGRTTHTIATENDPAISEIEFFRPDVNDSGLVVFRAIDADGRRAIWVGNGSEFMRVVSEHDVLPMDLGEARVDQEADEVPAFGGSPRINNAGQVAFFAGLTPVDDDQEEWGTGLFVATPVELPAE